MHREAQNDPNIFQRGRIHQYTAYWPTFGPFGHPMGFQKGPYCPKALQGEKLLSAQGHLGNVQNIMENPVWMWFTDTLLSYPFLTLYLTRKTPAIIPLNAEIGNLRSKKTNQNWPLVQPPQFVQIALHCIALHSNCIVVKKLKCLNNDDNDNDDDAGSNCCGDPMQVVTEVVDQPNLTEPFYIQRNKESGQKRKLPPDPLFWGTVYANLT